MPTEPRPKTKVGKPGRLVKNMLSGTLYSVIISVAGLAVYPLYLRYLGVETYGLWATVSALLTFGQLGQFGLDTAITRNVASAYGRGDLKSATEYISTAFLILLIPAIMLIAAAVLMRSALADLIRLHGELRQDGLRLIAFSGPLCSFAFYSNVLRAAVVGVGRADLANYSELAARSIQVVVAVGLLVAGYGVMALYIAFACFLILPAVYWAIILETRYDLRVFSSRCFRKDKAVELLRFGGTMMTATIANMLVEPFNKVVISRYIGLSQVTYFQIAMQVMRVLRGFFVKGLEAIMPSISQEHSRAGAQLKPVLAVRRIGLRFLYITAIPLYGALLVTAPVTLKLWLGDAYDPQIATVLRIFCVGWFLNALVVPDYYLFLGIGLPRYSVIEEWVRSGVNVVAVLAFLAIAKTRMSLYAVAAINSIALAAGAFLLKGLFLWFIHKKGKLASSAASAPVVGVKNRSVSSRW